MFDYPEEVLGRFPYLVSSGLSVLPAQYQIEIERRRFGIIITKANKRKHCQVKAINWS